MYTPATSVPTLAQLGFGQWERPDAPAPRLASPIVASDTTISFTSAFLDHTGSVFSVPTLIGIERDDGYVETVYANPAGWIDGGITNTMITRGIRLEGLDFTTSDPTLASDFNEDSPVFGNISGVIQALNSAGLTAQIGANIKFNGRPLFMGTGVAACPIFATTTARDSALVSPQNGDMCYVTADGVFYDYTAGSWIVRAAGGTFPNASTSVAGKVQIATGAQLAAGTNVGSTGADVVASGGSFNTIAAINTVPVGNSSGVLDVSWLPSGTYVIAPAGEAVNGTVTPQAVYISDGSGGRTAGSFYRTNSQDITNVALLPTGFITDNASSVGTAYRIKTGIVPGFTGLTPGAAYYTTNTVGAISATPLNGQSITFLGSSKYLGQAVSTTQLLAKSFSLTPVVCTILNANPLAAGTSITYNIYTGFQAANVQFNIWMMSAGGTTLTEATFNGAYNGNACVGNFVSETGLSAVNIGGIFDTFPSGTLLAGGSGTNSSNITATFSIHSDYISVTFVNVIQTTGGNCHYEAAITALPY